MEKQLTAIEKRDSNFYDAQYMIYYELPVLISKIFHAAFANCECGTPVIEKEDRFNDFEQVQISDTERKRRKTCK